MKYEELRVELNLRSLKIAHTLILVGIEAVERLNLLELTYLMIEKRKS